MTSLRRRRPVGAEAGGGASKPILLANIEGFWNPLLVLIDHMKQTAFIRANLWVDVLTADRVEDILPTLQKVAAQVPEAEKLMDSICKFFNSIFIPLGIMGILTTAQHDSIQLA